MNREDHRSPDGQLTLVIVDDDGDITIGFEGLSWHTHGDLLAASYPFADAPDLTAEAATKRLVEDIVANRVVITVLKCDGNVRDAWVTCDIEGDLRSKQADEEIEFRHWDGSAARPSAG